MFKENHCSLAVLKVAIYSTEQVAIIFVWKIVKDTHREKVPSNKPPALTKSTNMGIWVVYKTNQHFIRDS